MSSGQPVPYEEAAPVAERLRALLAPACEQIVVAGSLRRRKDSVSDIELVAEPILDEEPAGDLWGAATVTRDRLEGRLRELIAAGELAVRVVEVHRADGTVEESRRTGPSYQALVYGGLPVDLFIVRGDADFGVILAVRTGPAEFSHRLVTECRRYFREVRGGRLYAHGRYVPSATEEAFFRNVGLPWIEPERRSADRVRLSFGEGQA